MFIAALKRQSSDFNKTKCPFQHPDVGYKHARKALHLKTVHVTSEGSPLFAVVFSYEFPAERKANFMEYFSSHLLVFIMAGCLDFPPPKISEIYNLDPFDSWVCRKWEGYSLSDPLY